MDHTNDWKQKIRDNNPTNVVRKIILAIIDTALGFGLTSVIGNVVLPNDIWTYWTDRNPGLVLIIGILLYRVFMIMTLKATIGMMITRVKLLNRNYEELNVIERFFASILIPYNGTSLYDKK